MRRTFRLLTAISALSLVFCWAAPRLTGVAPGKGSFSSGTFCAAEGPSGGKPGLSASAAEINDDLKALYADISKTGGRSAAPAAAANRLCQDLKDLESLAHALAATGTTATEIRVQKLALRDRAQAFLHAWATFSLLVADVSAKPDPDPVLRDDLLALGRAADNTSALSLLLSIYQEIQATEDGDDRQEPLQHRLADPFFLTLGYDHPWHNGEKPKFIDHDRYIPSAADLLGNPDDKPEPQRELLSLWALVNLQIDTWRDSSGEKDPLGLVPLTAWLKQLQDNPDLSAFDEAGAGGQKFGQGLKDRAGKMQRFLAFRAACADDDALGKLASELKTARIAGNGAAVVAPEGGPRMEDLIEAARPIDGESLPQAEIWLRYVLLLSYQGEGVDVVADQTPKGNGIDAFWESTGLETPFLLAPIPNDGAAASRDLLRWGKWPQRPHFVRSVADATQAAYSYCLWEAHLRELETLRYQSLTDSNDRRRYVDDLTRHVDELESTLALHLKPYLGPVARPDATATKSEGDRLFRDLDSLFNQASSALGVQRVVLQATKPGDPSTAAVALQGASGFDGVSRWNINALPERTFGDYAERVRQATDRLKVELETFQWQQDLRDRFAGEKEEAEALESDLAAIQLGLEIARQGKQIADTYAKIDELGKQIDELNTKADTLIKKAAAVSRKAADLRLTLASQARDLAAAQVEALEEATAQAEQMVENASQSLQAMRGQLLEAANKIEDQKRKAGFLSIIKAVINVVGAALAPFTGGASLAVAQAATMAVDIYEKIDSLDFHDLGAAALKIADIVKEVDALGDLTINKLGVGGDGAKQAFADVKGWIKGAETDVKNLSEKARPLLDGLKKLGQSKAGQVLSALASDIPVSISDGKVKLDLGYAGIRFTDDRLKSIWSDILDQGGVLVNDAKTRARLAKLPFLTDDAYRPELKKAVDDLIRVCPQAALVNADVQKASEQVEQRKAELKEFIDKANVEQRKFLGKLFDGWVVVKDANGDVVAVERSISKEAKDFKVRLDAYKKKVETGVLTKLAGEIQTQNADLERLAGEAAKEQNSDRLRKIANEQVPAKIDELTGKLDALRTELALARGELKDAETHVEIAAADKDAATAMEEAAGLKVEADELILKQDLLKQTRSAFEVRRAELQIQQEEFRLQAVNQRAERAQGQLRRLYAACRRWGIDPLDQKDHAPPGLSLDGVLAVYDPADRDRLPRARLLLDRMTTDLVGMIQWVRVLNLTPKHYAGGKGWYAFDQFARVLDLQGRPEQPIVVASKLKAIADQLESDLDADLQIPPDNLRFVRAVAIDPASIHWFDQVADPSSAALPDGDPDKAVDPLFVRLQNQDKKGFQKMVNWEALQDLPLKLRRRALGYFRFRFSPDATVKRGDVYAEVAKAPSPFDSYYFFLQESSLVRERPLAQPAPSVDDLRFYFVPSAEADPNPGLPLSASLDRKFIQQAEGKPLNDQLEEEQRLGEIRNRLKLWHQFQLTPGVGDWKIYLLDSTDLTDTDRQNRIRDYQGKLVLTLRIPCLQVPAAAKGPKPLNIVVQRGKAAGGLVTGKLSVNGMAVGACYENDGAKIPAGTYPAHLRPKSSKNHVQGPGGVLGTSGDFLVELDDFTDADGKKWTAVQFHAGNKPEDSDGCILGGPATVDPDTKMPIAPDTLKKLRLAFYDGVDMPTATPDKVITVEVRDP